MAGEKQPIELLEKFLFPKLFQTFRMTIQPTKLMLAFSAMVIIGLAGWLMDLSKTVGTTPGSQGSETELNHFIANPRGFQSYIYAPNPESERTGVFSTLWHFSAARFKGAINALFAFNLPAVAANIVDCFTAARWAIKYHFFYCVVFFVITLAAISISGGAICRIAALQFARGEKPGLKEAVHFMQRSLPVFSEHLWCRSE